ncbi:MAG: chromosome segregation protein SMC [Gammaproteobacteria bacterium]|nr:chromosome segregation protein SMC [Rhodocyclaceae bacterium]MBU3909870.1 chromosome segregation protein SMC [Gammaproteobacteria bacterium]MBU3988005.1 chromosome segregation protein SMC [Gammaproteobacteria bacterium]MBU4003551.1 chromosome segregation protein SMC [Gammaproteobacteria bacterium]MBU4020090.1 chromosome segregation protein SMC [Gammaproteobacteria bacterium]
MRLIKLKVAGFKSFVEPTVVLFPDQLAGVVGPNGCGKSNIIDAVRWVLGESKASELRGESIQDVIFKGSGGRKEVGRASVELHFDNAQGRAAGQWSQYAEIVVKRILDREGNSSYYINNLHVRRRDVIDLFLGTGLGPRAYAIIGQGMISRIVEAKPDELRFFLEEAAGVTKYKERRKETEGRLEDAGENLARVDDIRGELGNQVTRLEGQAAVAQQYRDLQFQLNRRQSLLWFKKRKDAQAETLKLERLVDEAINRVEAETAALRATEARVEQAREAHFTTSDALHAAQAEMYSANAEVKRLESEIAHLRDARLRLETRLAQLDAQEQHWSGEMRRVEEEDFRWRSLLENSRERAATAAARHEEAAQRLPEAEDAVKAAEIQAAESRKALNAAEQGLRLAEADRGHAVRALDNLGQRRQRLDAESAGLAAPDPVLLATAQEGAAQAEIALEMAQEGLAALQLRQPTLEAALRSAREAMQAAHRDVTTARARHDALAQLQQSVGQGGDLSGWLKDMGLADAQPLWRAIQVDPGWETAVEAVLRERLMAVPGDTDTLQRALAAPPPATMALALCREDAAAVIPADSLRAHVRCLNSQWVVVLDEWLGDVRVVDSDAALTAGMLANEGWRVSRAGHVATPCGLTLYSPDVRTHGVIERQREIDALAGQIAALEEAEMLARETQTEAERSVASGQQILSETRRVLQEAQQRLHAAQVEALKLTQAQSRHDERAGQLGRDLAEIVRVEAEEKAAFAGAEDEAVKCREALAAARARMEEALELQRQRDTAMREVRALEHQLAREAQEAGFSEKECHSKLADNARAAETAKKQLEQAAGDRAVTQQDLAAISDAVIQEQLQAALAQRGVQESALAERRNALEGAASQLRMVDEERLKLEQGLQPARDKINELKLKQQAAQLNVEQYQERLAEAHVVSPEDEAALAAELTPGLRDSALQGDIARIAAEIEVLGPVNLAALEELASSRERKGYLDEQSADLATAIGTLEDAIRRIDRETREQLQETYETVNRHFGTLFPELFGGGEARLILTGEEILDAGIQIMAQPPGKRNSTIHLLSGGEKALTAIALVFALFQLNPAPFCMLDEVDAPLDDSNTVRFCEMVKRMSRNTQFVFITHNKITMEMAQQLIGVTMQEQGVSRVVAVDIEEALRMTEEMLPSPQVPAWGRG